MLSQNLLGEDVVNLSFGHVIVAIDYLLVFKQSLVGLLTHIRICLFLTKLFEFLEALVIDPVEGFATAPKLI